ncbi:MAG: magnesium transporter [Bdellovibrionales bacterium]|nr:magnesium transporter [Bdellovibrionales bacterium]
MSVFKHIPEISIHFSKVINTPVINESGIKIGKLKDFFVDYREVYPTVLAIQVQQSKKLFYYEWDDIISFSYGKIIIKKDTKIGRSRTYPTLNNKKIISSLAEKKYDDTPIELPAIGKIILDRQVVDTSGKKVVRVNDIEFIKAGQLLKVINVGVGLRSMIRRLGFELLIDSIIKVVKPKSPYLSKDTLINWKYVHAVPDRTVQDNVRLNLTDEDLKQIHPADLADILEDLDTHSRELIFSNLEPEIAAATLSEIEHDLQPEFIKHETPSDVAKIIENMDTDEAVDLLNELDDKEASEIISKIEDNEIQVDIQELLVYKEDSAGGLMSTEVFKITPLNTKTEILDIIQKNQDDFSSIYDIFIIDQDQNLIGTCPLAQLLIQSEDIMIGDIMNKQDIKSLSPDVPWKEVAHVMSKYNLINVPIIDQSSKLLGIISVDDVLPWLLNNR